MTSSHESLDSVAERARRALQDNWEARQPAQDLRPVAPDATVGSHDARPATPDSRSVAMDTRRAPPTATPQFHPSPAGLVEQRLAAICLVRELEPKRLCYAQRVQELTARLVSTPSDSVHWESILQWLGEARAELRRIEERLADARHLLNSTEWLVAMLVDPDRGGRIALTEGGDAGD